MMMTVSSNPIALVDLYQKCFYISMAIAIIAFALAIFLFFKLDIRGVFVRKSGSARRKAVKRLESRSAETGRLVVDDLLEANTGEVTGETESGKSGRTGRSRKTGRTDSLRKKPKASTPVAPGSAETVPISGGNASATVAISTQDKGGNNTEVFDYPRVELGAAAAQIGFMVTERIVVIHTNEVIEV